MDASLVVALFFLHDRFGFIAKTLRYRTWLGRQRMNVKTIHKWNDQVAFLGSSFGLFCSGRVFSKTGRIAITICNECIKMVCSRKFYFAEDRRDEMIILSCIGEWHTTKNTIL